MVLILPPFPICLNACLCDATAHCVAILIFYQRRRRRRRRRRRPFFRNCNLLNGSFLFISQRPISIETATVYSGFMASAFHLVKLDIIPSVI